MIEKYLQKYNRKERYWVIRTALGETGKEIKLSGEFCTRLKESTGIDVPDSAWWGVDYHLDWLFAALFEFADPKGTAPEMPYLNPEMASASVNTADKEKRVISGGIADIDLIVAYADTIILIEAKGVGSWSNLQMSKKYRRLIEFERYICSRTPSWPLDLEIFFVLMSPKEPTGPRLHLGSFASGGIKFLKMPVVFDDFQAVQRCNRTGDPDKFGEYWQIVAKSHSQMVD